MGGVAGHAGLFSTASDLAEIGYPIVEMHRDGTFEITKHPSTAGCVNSHTVKEQLLYEIEDPSRYITPDCVADFTTIRLSPDGPDRVQPLTPTIDNPRTRTNRRRIANPPTSLTANDVTRSWDVGVGRGPRV